MSDLSPRHRPDPTNRARLQGQNRIRLIGMCFGAAFLAIGGQLGKLTLFPKPDDGKSRIVVEERMPRPDIVDRNGVLLATDVAVASLYADPSQDHRHRRGHRAADRHGAGPRCQGAAQEAHARRNPSPG